VISEAIQQGIEPVRAIQMATINPARYFGLDHLFGGIAPGRLANILVVSSLKKPTPCLVMAKGTLVAEEGRMLVPEFTCPVTDVGNRPFDISGIGADMFRVVPENSAESIPVIRIVDLTVTDREDLRVPVKQGIYQPEGDILLATFITRDGKKVGRGFVRGFCPGLGGIASSIAHETHGLLILGQSHNDMALAANDVLKMGGGISLVHRGEIKARIPLPIGGITSNKNVPELAREIIVMHQNLKDLGCSLEYPLWTLGFLSFTSVLRLRITCSGVYDVREGKIIFS
jgi:adenine deaminase